MLTDPTLKSKVDALWDRFWSGGISNPLSAINSVERNAISLNNKQNKT